MKMPRQKRLQQFKRLMRAWQRKLGLEHWRISCGWQDGATLSKDAGYDAVASVDFELPRQIAAISISKDVDWDTYTVPDGPAAEHAIVHELCHLVLASAGMNRALTRARRLVHGAAPPLLLEALEEELVAAREAACDTLVRFVRRSKCN